MADEQTALWVRWETPASFTLSPALIKALAPPAPVPVHTAEAPAFRTPSRTPSRANFRQRLRGWFSQAWRGRR